MADDNAPDTWKDRLRAEREELGKRLVKLSVFFASNTFDSLAIEDQALIREQRSAMCDYWEALTKRLDRVDSSR